MGEVATLANYECIAGVRQGNRGPVKWANTITASEMGRESCVSKLDKSRLKARIESWRLKVELNIERCKPSSRIRWVPGDESTGTLNVSCGLLRRNHRRASGHPD